MLWVLAGKSRKLGESQFGQKKFAKPQASVATRARCDLLV